MVTYYVLFDPCTKEFAKAGHYPAITYSINLAKHFTSEWGANKYKAAHDLFCACVVKKIQRY